MRTSFLVLTATTGAWLAVAIAQAADPTAAPIYEQLPESSPTLPTPREPAQLLSLGLRDAFVPGGNFVTLAAPVAADYAEADAQRAARYADIHPGPARVGIVRSLGTHAVFAELALQTVINERDFLWTIAIRSPGAQAIRVHFSDCDLSDAELRIYGLHKGQPVARGPFTDYGPRQKGDFWAPTVPGDTAYIEAVGSFPPRFTIGEIVHFDHSPYAIDDGAAGRELSCHLDVQCESVNQFARRATGQMNYISGGGSYVCTGTLLNDLDSETAVPYFLTAAHCVNSQSEVNTLEVVWLWERDGCGGPLPNYAGLDRSDGGTLVATQSSNDMSFIRLTGAVPPGTALAGWTTATGLSNAHGIHHPAGSWKRAVFLDGVGFCPGCLCHDPTDYDYYNMTRGLTEGGSSGSGVFNSSGQLAGQLRGKCSVCCDPDDLTCSNIDDYWNMYGEFEETHPVIRNWLEIGGTIHVNHANLTAPWNGTPSDPMRLVSQAHALAWNGARIKIQAGSYNETLTLSKRVTLIATGGTAVVGQ